jgi:hypothetical protein
LSGLRGKPLPTFDDLAGRTAKVFQSLHPDARIQRLDEGDRMALVELLRVYEEVKQEGASDPDFEQMEKVGKVAAEAAAFGAKLESEVFQGPFADYMHPYTSKYRELPKQLDEFSKEYGFYMRRFGKSGQKAKIHADYWLVMASEFVRLKTRQYCDGQVGELLQAIGNHPDLEAKSDEAIRKKRLFLKKHYRWQYDDALRSARRACDGGSFLVG